MAEAGQARLKTVFMGTPEFAAESLKALLDWEGCEVLAAYTQPDRPCGRGLQCKPSAVKKLALERGVTVRQPENFKDPAEVEDLRALEPDVLVVAAYGLILPVEVLDVPKLMPVNVHASLLPRWRGAAPIQRAIQAGEPATGITIMRMEEGLDSGPILLQRAMGIAFDDHAGKIHDELARMGGLVLVEALERLRRGRLAVIEQDHDLATHAPKLSKKEGLIDFAKPAREVHNHIRAMHPWPGAFFLWKDGSGKKVRLTVTPGRVGEDIPKGACPGQVLGCREDVVAIACEDKEYLVPTLRPDGRREMNAEQFYCGYLHRCQCPDDSGE